MTEKGIMFSTDMVQATLKGIKSHTRRTAGLEKVNDNPDDWYCTGTDGILWGFKNRFTNEQITCKPRYLVGDILYIKETYAIRNDGQQILYKSQYENINRVLNLPQIPIQWKSSMFIKKIYARPQRYEVISVKPQRLHDMTENEARAEGYPKGLKLTPPIIWYSILWDKINGKVRPEDREYYLDDKSNRHLVKNQQGRYAWVNNPFVWDYGFKPITS